MTFSKLIIFLISFIISLKIAHGNVSKNQIPQSDKSYSLEEIVPSVPKEDVLVSEYLPDDAELKYGTLANGLTYYVRKNTKPEGQAYFKLLVNVGSIAETEKEQGIAHFVEHVVLAGSKNFPNREETENYFKQFGMQLGADHNAFTTTDMTQYFIVVPTAHQEVIETSIRWMADTAFYATISEESVETERAAILDELQSRRSHNQRFSEHYYNTLTKDSSIYDRLPGGKKEIVKTATSAMIRSFYEKWYRPELMAFIAVGDFDPDSIVTLINSSFGGIPASEIPAKNPSIDIKRHNNITIFTDDETTESTIRLTKIKLPHHPKPQKIKNIKNKILSDLLQTSLSLRLKTESFNPESPFTSCAYYSFNMINTIRLHEFVAGIKQNRHLDAVKVAINILKQYCDHGVSEEEFKQAQQAIAASYTELLTQCDKKSHYEFSDQYEEHFYKNKTTAIKDEEAVIKLKQKLLLTLTKEDLNKYACKNLPLTEAYTFLALNTAAVGTSSQDDLLNNVRDIVDKSLQEETVPFNFTSTALDLIKPSLEKEETLPTLSWESLTEIDGFKTILPNGIPVFFKKTSYEKDMLTIVAQAPGGYAVDENNLVTLHTLPLYLHYACYAGIKSVDLAKNLMDKPSIYWSPVVTSHAFLLYGGTSRKDSLYAFNLLTDLFDKPNASEEALKLTQSTIHEAIEHDNHDTLKQVGIAFDQHVYGNDKLFRIFTHQEADELSVQKFIELYKKYFTPLNRFTFAIVGDIELDELSALLIKTLAQAPTTFQQATLEHQPIRTIPLLQSKHEYFNKQTVDQSFINISFPLKPLYHDQKTRLSLTLLSTILHERLMTTLREKNKLVYGSSVDIAGLNDYDAEVADTSAHMRIEASCDSTSMSKVLELTQAEINSLMSNGCSSEELKHSQAITVNHLERTAQSNNFWAHYILHKVLIDHKEQPESIEMIKRMITNVSLKEFNDFITSLRQDDLFYALSVTSKNQS